MGGGVPPQIDNAIAPTPSGVCRRFWSGVACSFIQPNGQPCRYRHCCRVCQAFVSVAETAAHLRSHNV
jgi:hypothetical protein